MLRTWQSWVYYSQWLIAAGAASQCWQTKLWLHLPPLSLWLLVFVFSSTMVVYLFHFQFYWLKKAFNERQHFFIKYRLLLLLQFVLAAVFGAIAFYKIALHLIVPVAVLGLSAACYIFFIQKPFRRGIFRYNGLFKIITLTTVWTAVTSILPVAATGFPVFSAPHIFYYSIRWFFMVAICLPFDVRDMHTDGKKGNMTIPVLIGQKNTFTLCYVCLLLHALLPFAGVLAHWYPPTIVLANLPATAITAFCIYYSSRHLRDDFSWFLLDSNFVIRAAIIGSVLIF